MATTAASTVTHPTIKTGARGDAVRRAQENLQLRFYDPGPIDGMFGAKTHKAVRRYQGDRELTNDGIVGPATWALLDPPTVRRGADGDAVTMLQKILASFEHGPWDPGAVDGDFGPATEKAVKQFQSDTGLTADGIVGQRTWAMLGS